VREHFKIVEGHRDYLQKKKKRAKKYSFLTLSLSLSLSIYAMLKSYRTNICLVPMHRDFATPPDTQAQKKKDKPALRIQTRNRYFCVPR